MMKPTYLFLFFLGSLQVNCQSNGIHTLKFENTTDTKNYFRYTGENVPVISGHRGGADINYPENSIATFENVLIHTPAIFEIDPRMTKDDKVVLLHDETLDRTTTGSGKLNAITFKEAEEFMLTDLEGNTTPDHIPLLSEVIQWGKGKTVLNLDVKDVPLETKAQLVKQFDAFHYVIFTVHDAEDAKFFYDFDDRSLFSAFVKTKEALESYESLGIPWDNVLIAYVGSESTSENKELYGMLHDRGVMVMVSAAPTYDKLESSEERAKAYRKILEDGADVIESDRPIEVASAIKSMYPENSSMYKFWETEKK